MILNRSGCTPRCAIFKMCLFWGHPLTTPESVCVYTPISPRVSFILYNGSSTNSGHHMSIVKVGDTCYKFDYVKITRIELNNFCNLNTVYMLFDQLSIQWKHLRGIGLIWIGATCWVSCEEGIKTPHWTGSFWRPYSSLAMCCFFIVMFGLGLHVPGFSNLFNGFTLNALDLYMKYTAYISCVVCFCPEVTPYTRSVICLLTLLHFWLWCVMHLDNEHFYTANVFPFPFSSLPQLQLYKAK